MISLSGKSNDFVNIALSSASDGKLAEVKQVLNLRLDWLHQVGPRGRPILWEAAFRGRTPTVKHLLEQGAEPHIWMRYFPRMLVEVSAYVVAVWKQHVETDLHSGGRRNGSHQSSFYR